MYKIRTNRTEAQWEGGNATCLSTPHPVGCPQIPSFTGSEEAPLLCLVLCDLGQVPWLFWAQFPHLEEVVWDPVSSEDLSSSDVQGVCVSPPPETKASEAWVGRSPGPGRGNSWGQAGWLPIVQGRRRRRCTVLSNVTAG